MSAVYVQEVLVDMKLIVIWIVLVFVLEPQNLMNAVYVVVLA